MSGDESNVEWVSVEVGAEQIFLSLCCQGTGALAKLRLIRSPLPGYSGDYTLKLHQHQSSIKLELHKSAP
jgi:hypothetical protein